MKGLRQRVLVIPAMAALLATSAAVSTFIASPGTAHAAPAEWGTMKNGYGLCLDDTGYSTTGGTRMQVWGCNGKASQNWHIYESQGAPPFEYMFQVQQSGMCLDEYQRTGPEVIQWPCNPNDPAQWWIATENTNGGYQFTNAGTMDSGGTAGDKVNTTYIGNLPNSDPDDSWGLPPFAYP